MQTANVLAVRSYSSTPVRMVLFPRQTKFRKQQKGGSFNSIVGVNEFQERKHGIIELRACEAARVTSKQIEAMKSSALKVMKKAGRLLVTIFPHTPITKKPLEVRMGKGKGAVDHWIAKVPIGASICQIETPLTAVGMKAMQTAQERMPMKCRIIAL